MEIAGIAALLWVCSTEIRAWFQWLADGKLALIAKRFRHG